MNKMIPLFALLFLSACAEGLQITSAPADITVAQAADPAQVQMLPVQFRVINRNNLDAFVQEIRTSQSTENPVFIAMTTQDYENLAINIADLRRYIQQQQSIIVYYRRTTGAPAASTAPATPAAAP